MIDKRGYFYILTNKYNRVLYAGSAVDLRKRLEEHRVKADPKSFTAKYNVTKLVYFEALPSINAAIKRERQVKGWVRVKKIELIEKLNPEWRDLGEEFFL
jgi:putative endonuclease